MKKIFTLMLTMVFALTICAAPVGPKKGTQVKAVPFQKAVSLTPAKKVQKAPKFHQIQNAMELQKNGKPVIVNKTVKMAKPAATVKNINKAPRKAEGDVVDLNISKAFTLTYYDPTNEVPTGDWYFGAADDSNGYVIRLDYLKTKDEKYGTFTLDDLDTEYSYLTDYISGEETLYYQYLEGTTFTVSQKDGHDVVEGTLVCDNGVTYNFHAEFIPTTIDIEGTEMTTAAYFSSDNDWFIIFQNDTYRVTLDLLSPDGTFDGTYTENEALATWCCATNVDTYDSETFETFSVTLKLGEGVTDPMKGCEITGTAIGVNGNTYNFHFYKAAPLTPTETVDADVELNYVEWPATNYDCKGYFELTEKDTNAKWTLALNQLRGENLEEGYINTELTKRVDAEGNVVTVDHGTFSETFDPETFKVHVAADLVMTNAVEYRYAFDYQIETIGEASYDYTNLVVDDSWYGWYGLLWYEASTDETYFEMTATEFAPCVYDNSNASARIYFIDEDGSYSAQIEGLAILSAEATYDSANQPVLTCKFLGEDKVVYTINAHFEIPAITDTIDVNIDGLTVHDFTEDMGAYQIYGYNADQTQYVSITPESTQIAGHYTLEDLCTYASYNYLVLDITETSYEQNTFYSADFDVTLDDKDVTLTGQFQAGSHLVNMTLHGKVVASGMTYDVEDQDLDVTFTKDDLSELVKYEDNGYAYVRLQNAERNDMFAMLVYLDTFDDVSMIPEGTYVIDDSYDVNTVQHGSITDDLSTVYPTFYATCTDDGYLNLPLWFFEGGTVTVVKDADGELAFEVNGLNSYERTCHVVYNMENTGIKTVDASEAGVKKMLQNNQVVIMKGNQKFNAIGQEVKF